MAKLTKEQKLEIYKKRKDGVTISQLSEQYNIEKSIIKYFCRLIDVHAIDILRKSKNTRYSLSLKEEIVQQVLLHNQSVTSTAIQYGLLSKETLLRWIKSYKENDGVIIEKKRGRPSAMKKKAQSTKAI